MSSESSSSMTFPLPSTKTEEEDEDIPNPVSSFGKGFFSAPLRLSMVPDVDEENGAGERDGERGEESKPLDFELKIATAS